MRKMIAANSAPWADGWESLINNDRSYLNRWEPGPLETVIRGVAGDNVRHMWTEMQRTYQLAIRWKVSGDEAYGDKAVSFLNAWASTMTSLTGSADRFLAAGLYSYQWANAAEIMRTYEGWARDDVVKFQRLLLEVFYPLCDSFLSDHNGTEWWKITNYWANWDLCTLCGIFAIGVFCDRPDLVDRAVDYFKASGRGNGAAAHCVVFLHPGYQGQWQESGRDQGHSTLGIALVGAFCEMAWNQGIDLYGHWNNRVLAGAEYVAKTQLTDTGGQWYEMPFSKYSNNHGAMTALGEGTRGNGRPGWELLYNHYVNRRGLSAPWVSAMARKYRPEWYDGTGDSPGLGTLLHSRESVAITGRPSGLSAHLTAGLVLISWWGTASATSYSVKRASSANGPFTIIATVTDPRTYTDAPMSGIWYYAVSAISDETESGLSNVARVALPGELRLHLPLDGDVKDLGGGNLHGILAGNVSWSEGRNQAGALTLAGDGGHVVLPPGVMSDIGDFTIAVWIFWSGTTANSRILDFGWNDTMYVTLMARKSHTSFAITGASYFGDQALSVPALPTGRWVHVAVTYSGTTVTIYVDGISQGSNNEVALAPWQLGETPQNWLGRSQYPNDPPFNGRMQDLRIYSGALDVSQVALLAA